MTIRSHAVGMVALLLSVLVALPLSAQDQDAAGLWADFNHYVLVARPDLAKAAGEALLQKADEQQLLDVVEASDYANYDRTLQRAAKTEGLGDIASQLDARIQAARIARSRESQRIGDDISKLANGQRPYLNAVERLKSAGQYAAPQLLAVLHDGGQTSLHPYVLQAMVAVGRPLVAPLSEALPQLDPVNQGRIAQVLAEIGYPHPLPYLKQIIDDSATDANARVLARKAYEQLLERTELPSDLNAAMLYLLLGESQYKHQTSGQEIPGYDAAEGKGIVWHYDAQVGLVAVPVPGSVFGDVLAMRAATAALALDPSLDKALSLYLMANLRRQNNLPQGVTDPSYAPDRQDPMFYALLAGPARLQDVLARALSDRDPVLAIDAIDALSETAGVKDQVGGDGDKPLVSALSFPDPMVRFRAAAALTSARPADVFPGSYRVVPVLAEALRPSDTKVALVLSDKQELLNSLVASAGELGYTVLSGTTLAGVQDQVATAAAVDVIITGGSLASIQTVLAGSEGDYRLGAVPVLAMVNPAQQVELNERYGNQSRLVSSVIPAEAETLTGALESALKLIAPKEVGAETAKQMALESLQLLATVALASDVYNVQDAQPALIASLDASDAEVVTGSAAVLALINSAESQSALIESALKASGDSQVALLHSLADSASHFGNMVSREQSDLLLTLVLSSTGDTALAASRAHGALALPTSNSVQEILK
ncbi:MAG: hypothetical protein IT445_11740 [Phycisphaeraceae bacterium]|nr:hypothetical protein [Phycisphaeraceae bacterium]